MFVAGRIEFLGKHTDYCGGQSIVCAIDRGFSVAASASRRGSLVITDEVSGETLTIPFAENAADETAGWAIYPAIVASRVSRNFADEIKSGVTVSFRSDLPHAAGLSSSSALITAIFCAVAEHSGIAASEKYKRNISTKADLAEFLGCIENGTGFKELAGASGVGTFGGSQDHAAIVGSTSGTLSHFTFSPLEKLGKFSFPAEFCFAIASSGVVAEKTGAAMARYNNLSRMARAIVDAWPEKGNSLASIIRANGIESVADNLRNTKSEFSRRDLENRLRAFYEESFEIIPAVAVKLRGGQFEEIGELIDSSQLNAETLLGNQTVETVFLQRDARKLGAVAASAFGAGFGGSVYAVVPKADAEDFVERWRESYRMRFPERYSDATFFLTIPSESRGLTFGREAA